jgi:hypothetical protein
MSWTITSVVLGLEDNPNWSVTTSANLSVSWPSGGCVGVVNVGRTALASERATGDPEVCCQWKVRGSPSGSDDADPSNVTGAFSFTV